MTKICKELMKKITKKIQSDAEASKAAAAEYKYIEGACPNCGAVGQMKPYGSYGRKVVTYINGKVEDEEVQNRRFKCQSCTKTHALVPDVLVPYSPYSLCFKLSVLLAYFERTMPVVDICNHFGIVKSTLYEWKAQFIEHKELLVGKLASQKTTGLAFIREYLESAEWPSPLQRFHEKYGFSFLQGKRSATRLVPT